MSRWGNLLGWGRREHEVRQAITAGELYFAANCVGRKEGLREQERGVLARDLTRALITRSREKGLKGDFSGAWKDLTVASSVAADRDLDWLAGEKSQLVELTVESADRLLAEGKMASVLRVIRELRVRRILDWRADQIERAAQLVQTAESHMARGELAKAMDDLMEARNLRPDLEILKNKLDGVRTRRPQFRALRDGLRRALLAQQWPEVARTCREMLAIAPGYQVALDARRQLAGQDDGRLPLQVAGQQGSYEHAVGTVTPQEFTSPPSEWPESVSSPTPDHDSSTSADRGFMLWIDGVGGFRVCPRRENWIGQAVADSQVSIPLRGDLLRRHVRIQAVERTQVLEPMGEVQIDGRPVSGPTPLKDGQTLAMGAIKLGFYQPHPLSGSARLGFQSRHRTEPWSDGVLLVNGPVMLGPGPKNHVVCRHWDRDLMLFERDGKWWVRTSGKIEVDGIWCEGEAEIGWNSRVAGDDFSLSLESL